MPTATFLTPHSFTRWNFVLFPMICEYSKGNNTKFQLEKEWGMKKSGWGIVTAKTVG